MNIILDMKLDADMLLFSVVVATKALTLRPKHTRFFPWISALKIEELRAPTNLNEINGIS